MRTALLSVYDKAGIVEFARELVNLDFQLIASGGTARTLQAAGLEVKDVAELVGGGPILGHRVVTLSREIHAGLLAKDTLADRYELEKSGIPFIDLVCVDLYPLAQEINRAGSTRQSVIEMTDIGGPTLLRAAAKGGRWVIATAADRQEVLTALKDTPFEDPSIKDGIDDMREYFATKAEAIVAAYVQVSARYRSGGLIDGFVLESVGACLYGENPQIGNAGLFKSFTDDNDPLALHRFELIRGTTPSYNNYCDLDRLLQTITHIAAAWEVNRGRVPAIAVGAKHGNPCGAAVGDNPTEVLAQMIEGDPRALMGGLVITNFAMTDELAELLLIHRMNGSGRRLLDGVIAPQFSQSALDALERKKDKCRLIANPALLELGVVSLDRAPRFRYVRGGFLRQDNYMFVLSLEDPALERHGQVSKEQEDDLLLAWAIGSTSNSNTITLVRNRMLIGNGVGQQDRVGAAQLAVLRARGAGHSSENAVAYSDSFFPFRDGPQVLYEAGITAILASSGSVNDGIVRDCADGWGRGFLFIPDKMGRGFFGH